MAIFCIERISLSGADVGDWQRPSSGSVSDDMEGGHSELTVTCPPAVMLGPVFTQVSIRETREPLSVSEVPSSLALYVTYPGDSGSQTKYSSSNAQLAQYSLNTTSTALVRFFSFSAPFLS